MGFFTNNFVENITIGSNVKFFNNSMFNAFSGCSNFNQPVNIPDSVTNMANTFQQCRIFNQPVNIPDGVTNMIGIFNSSIAFNQPVNIPNSVTNITNILRSCYAFNQPVNIPDSVTNMASAFYMCNNLTHPVTIGNGVTYIGQAFYGCNKVGNITIKSRVVNKCYGFLGSKNNFKRVNIFVPAGSTTNTTIANNMDLVGVSGNWNKYTNYYSNLKNNVYVYYNYF